MDEAKLRAQLIYSLNGKPLSNLTEVRALLDGVGPGEVVVLHVERNGRLRYIEFPIE